MQQQTEQTPPSSALSHDAYDEESEKLAAVVLYLQDRLRYWEANQPVTASDQLAADAIHKELEKLNAGFASALDQPYFGRLDYLVLDAPRDVGERKRVYIGAAAIEEHAVYSWTAPVARLWYTNDAQYPAPAGRVRVRMDLKRFLRIRDLRLVALNDVYRRALPEAREGERATDALTEALSETGGDDALSVIVETIEPHQYEAIANTQDRALIVQGAAGSGKSEIGLHRIAYLLSRFNDLPERERPTPETTLFIGPSKSFLEYAADLLPALGVERGVTQITRSDWMRSLRSANVRFEARVWNDLLARGEMTRFSEGAEAFKGSLDMAGLLERHVRARVRSIESRCRSALANRSGKRFADGIVITRDEINEALDAAFSGGASHPNRMRRAFIERIARLARNKSASIKPQGQGRFEELRRNEEIGREAADWVDEAWPAMDLRREYANLLSDGASLPRPIRRRLSDGDVAALRESAQRGLADGFDDADEGALTYLDHLLNGAIAPKYRHIVVDEAQDISPIEFKLLSVASVNNWFTVMGDAAQRLAPYRGVQRWGEVGRVLGRDQTTVQQARLSYRANKHITRFNNRVLRLYEKTLPAPIPYEREGRRPEYHRHATVEGMYEAVVNDLSRIRAMPGLANAGVAILARDRANLNRFQKFCEARGISDVALIGQERRRAGGAVLARIPDVRGLEYNAVIVLGVNDAFSDTPFNQRLLYVAVSRAKHYLSLHWSGKQSPILAGLYDGGVRFRDRRPSESERGA